MVIKHHTENYEDFCTFMDKFDPKGQVVHILFEGAVDPVTKQSWCSDCVEADPIIESHLSLLPENSHFIISIVGDRPTWKDAKNPFRTDKRLKLMVIPTLIRWKSPHRLEGEQLANPDLVEMMFTDDIEDSADFKDVKVDVQTPIPTAVSIYHCAEPESIILENDGESGSLLPSDCNVGIQCNILWSQHLKRIHEYLF